MLERAEVMADLERLLTLEREAVGVGALHAARSAGVGNKWRM
jgi:H2-forming N5,N10-methylenetetrahydromethanopterin dehydrogenase-like enzyme